MNRSTRNHAARWFKMWVLLCAGAFLCVGGVVGCAGTYDGNYWYGPQPAEMVMESPNTSQGEVARGLVSLSGIRRADQEHGIPAAVEMKVRLENKTEFPIVWHPTSMLLIAGNLEEFPTPTVDPAGEIEISPQSHAEVVAAFPFPGDQYPGKFDLEGLNLRITIRWDEMEITQSVAFTRQRRYYPSHYRYYDYPWHPFYGHPYYHHSGFHWGFTVGTSYCD